MILQNGMDQQISNILHILLPEFHNEVLNWSSISELKNKYNSFFSKKYNLNFENQSTEITTDSKRISNLVKLFNGAESSNLDDLKQKELLDTARISNLQNENFNFIKDSILHLENKCPQHFLLMNLIINDIFILDGDNVRGGSSSTAIGVIWAAPRTHFSKNDFLEFLIHELTHHCMFIDEIRYGHYYYKNISEKATWAKSAILNVSRPLDKVIHSIMVSLEILLLRELIIGHPKNPKIHAPSYILMQQIKESIESISSIILNTKNNLVTDRAIFLIDNVKEKLIEIKC